MDKLIKQIIFSCIFIIIIYSASIYIINYKKNERLENDRVVNYNIQRGTYKNNDDFKKLLKSLNEVHESTITFKLLHANHLIEQKKYDQSIKVLEEIKSIDSITLEELRYTLMTRALSEKGLCDNAYEFFNKISSYKSIKEISKLEIQNCKNHKGVNKWYI